MKDLSIIVPVYNSEKYILKCVKSLFNQGLNDSMFEVILVNDGTSDGSFDVIRDVIRQHSNIVILEQENSGMSLARNNAMQIAKGKYLMFVDSDDVLINGSLNILLRKALQSHADMVVADFLKLTDEEVEFQIPESAVKEFCSVSYSEREAFMNLYDPNQCFIWRTLYLKEFLDKNQLHFIPSIYFEDIPFTTECYLNVKKVLYCPIPIYVYRRHTNSTVSTINKKKLLDLNCVIQNLWLMRNKHLLSMSEKRKIGDSVFSTFSLLIWYLTHVKGMFIYRKIVVEDLKRRVPDLFFYNSMKQILVSVLYKYMPYNYLKFRSIIN